MYKKTHAVFYMQTCVIIHVLKLPQEKKFECFILLLLLLLRLFTLPQCRTYTPGAYNLNSVGKIPVGEQQIVDQNTRQTHKGGPP